MYKLTASWAMINGEKIKPNQTFTQTKGLKNSNPNISIIIHILAIASFLTSLYIFTNTHLNITNTHLNIRFFLNSPISRINNELQLMDCNTISCTLSGIQFAYMGIVLVYCLKNTSTDKPPCNDISVIPYPLYSDCKSIISIILT